ncbi:MAG: Crp/Fnr family transcriptional regulator [Porticoccus sp.]
MGMLKKEDAMQFQKIHGQLLRKHHLFSALSDSDMTTLMRGTRVLSVGKGEFLFQQNEEARHFYFVVSGCMKLFRTLPDGTEKIIELVPSNQTFAEALMFNAQMMYPVSAQAVDSSELFSFSNIDYMTLLKSSPDLSLVLLGDLSRRLRMRLSEIEVLSLKNSTHRVVRYLMTQIVDSDSEYPQFDLPVAKRLIAGQLAIQPETFSRIVHRLKEEGVIDMKGKEVTVLDRKALANYE